jgi:uncharacterized LabA/DUF88 family protein
MTTVMAYVDGMNLYNGLQDKFQRRYLWLDVQAMVTRLLKPGQNLAGVRYFTARLLDREAAIARQACHLDALSANCTRLQIIEGRYQRKQGSCRACGQQWVTYEEKETDTNIAAAVIHDAILGLYDTALLVSADSDMIPAVKLVKQLSPEKRIVVAAPPGRWSSHLAAECDGAISIRADKVRQSLLPDTVMTSAGVVLKRPSMWR